MGHLVLGEGVALASPFTPVKISLSASGAESKTPEALDSSYWRRLMAFKIGFFLVYVPCSMLSINCFCN